MKKSYKINFSEKKSYYIKKKYNLYKNVRRKISF